MKFVLDNNDAGDVNVNSVTIRGLGNGAATTYSNFTAAIFVDGVQQGSSRISRDITDLFRPIIFPIAVGPYPRL